MFKAMAPLVVTRLLWLIVSSSISGWHWNRSLQKFSDLSDQLRCPPLRVGAVSTKCQWMPFLGDARGQVLRRRCRRSDASGAFFHACIVFEFAGMQASHHRGIVVELVSFHFFPSKDLCRAYHFVGGGGWSMWKSERKLCEAKF